MTFGRSHEPFSDPEWIYEIKWDGFRSLVYVDRGFCRLVSRNGNEFKSCPELKKLCPANSMPALPFWTGKLFAWTKTAKRILGIYCSGVETPGCMLSALTTHAFNTHNYGFTLEVG